MNKKVSYHTLGCKLNFSETSTIARQFGNVGYEKSDSGRDADICVINTCSVTGEADKKCRYLIRKLHRENPEAMIVVTGCYAQLRADEIAQIEGVDLVVSNNDKGALVERVMELTGKGRTKVYGCESTEITNFFASFSTADRTRAYLKVQDGCDYKCSYCTIPYARGGSRNIPIAQCVSEAETIARGGQREIVLTGINTGDFGRTSGEPFIDLLKTLEGVEGIDRYRISSIEPNLLTDEIISFTASSAKFQPHFHIPLQSGCDKILRLMRRRYTTSAFTARIRRVREYIPHTFFGIDVIVGFPGETEADFETTYKLLEDLRPAYLHVFPYSERPGTPAVNFDGKVDPAEQARRVKQLTSLSERLHREFYERFKGTEAMVLFEGASRGGMMTGFTENYIKVEVPFARDYVNRICRVHLDKITESGVMSGRIIAE